MTFNPGEQVGPYRIMEQLGQGGMATVFKAYHAALDRYVAIKVLHPAFREDPNFSARFQREARAVARLEHPNIVPIYDYTEHEKRPHLVMKFIEGETLKMAIQRGPLPPDEIERIIEAVGAALHYAHTQGVLHRDVKPSNVILSKDGQVYLADFGLARIAQSGEATLTSDVIIGTPQYISPEQAMAKKDLDEGTDIYSFGIMIYEMVVGRVPFNADTPFSVIHDHIYTPLPLPSKVTADILPDVERVLLKALAKDRSDRYPDVASMVLAFKEAWKSQATRKSQTEIAIAVPRPEGASEAIPTIPPAMGPLSTVVATEPAPVTETQIEPGPAVIAAGPAPATEIREPKRRSHLVWIAAGAVIVLFLFLVFVALPGRDLGPAPSLVPSIPAARTAKATPAVPTSNPTSTAVPLTATKAPAYPPGVLFLANFDNGLMPLDWYAESSWRVRDGALCGSGHVFTGASKGDNWRDYRAKFRLRLDSGSIHLNLRQTSAPGGLNRYFFTVDQTGFGLEKQTGETFTGNLAGLNLPFALNQWTPIELVAQGSRLLMLVNGIVVLDFTDGDNPIGAGTLTLETIDSTACVDHILVSDLAGKPPVDVLLEQHFDSAQSLKGWRTTDAQGNPNTAWQVKDGALCGSGHNWAVFTDMPLSDFTMRYRLILKNGAIHLNSRISEESRYRTWIGTVNWIATLTKDMPNEGSSILATGRARILPEKYHDVMFSLIGGRIQFWLDGKRVYDFTDKAPLDSGLIGFESLDAQSVCIDDLIISLPSLAQTP